MRVQLLSDLHFEFHRDGGQAFVASLDPAGIDVVVLAGDIAVGEGIVDALRLFGRHFQSATVLFVHGNHEFYGSDRETVHAHTRRAIGTCSNVRWLDCTGVELDGQRFLGAPLWFPEEPQAARVKHHMTDFNVIDGFESWAYAENERARAFFERELRPGDVAITHHLPSRTSIAPQYAGHPLNPFFLTDLESLIVATRPAYWLHGHTHESMNYRLGATTVLCNPFGYVGVELNPRFDELLVFEL